MAELLTTDTDLTTVADAIRAKTGGTGSLTFPAGFASAIDGIGSYDSDAATAGDILSGKKAFVGNATVTGTIDTKGSETFHPSASDRTIPANTYLSGAQTIKGVSISNLSAGNIKKGVTVSVGDGSVNVASVTGTYDPVYTSMPQSGSCFCPFMFQTTDTKNVRFYWAGNGWQVSAADSGSKAFIVPCAIRVTLYPESTSTGTSQIVLYPGNVYSLNIIPGNTQAATITGTGVSISVHRITNFEVV